MQEEWKIGSGGKCDALGVGALVENPLASCKLRPLMGENVYLHVFSQPPSLFKHVVTLQPNFHLFHSFV